MIKVVVVDDSAFMRMIITEMIESSRRFKVIAKFRNGKELLNKIQELKPDVITLDIEMPEIDGLDTLKELKRRGFKYPIIMLSSVDDSNKTMQCLEAGAIDFIKKPTDIRNQSEETKEYITEKLYEIISYNSTNTRSVNRKINKVNNGDISKKIDAIVIGASTGGPKALQEVLTKLDRSLCKPVFVVQHMPKGFTKAFADRLNKICELDVVEATENMEIRGNTIYIAPGGFHMTVGNGRNIRLNTEPSMWGVRPAVDKLFESAVKVYKSNLLSVVLTGMGRDGANGTVLVKDAGGVTISEDQSTCTIYGMPKSAYETGKVDMVMPLTEVGINIMKIAKGRI